MSASRNYNFKLIDKITLTKISDLKFNEMNPRQHSDEQISSLAASIARFGFNTAVLTDDDNVIIAGEARVKASVRLGLDEVPCVNLSHLSEDEKRAYMISDNQIADLATWNQQMLGQILGKINTKFMPTELGYNQKHIDDILARARTSTMREDEDVDDIALLDKIPEDEARVICKQGDIWQLGNHRLICGDSTDPQTYENLMAGKLADLIFTDPPYGVSYKSNKMGGILNDDLRGNDLYRFLSNFLVPLQAFSKSKASYYICFPWKQYLIFNHVLASHALTPDACIVWNKKQIGLGNNKYRPQHEMIFFCQNKGQWFGNRAQSDVWTLSRENTNDYIHPTQKPVELIMTAILNSAADDAIVLDPFGGSGSTLMACEYLGRTARLIELDLKFCDCIINRWQNYSGELAINQNTGKSFAAHRLEKLN